MTSTTQGGQGDSADPTPPTREL